MMDSTGSSPHTRGAQNKSMGRGGTSRFIPAYAGNALRATPAYPPPPVHPRIRGERMIVRLLADRMDGSSPHTLGTRAPQPGPARRYRFIPACAGNAGMAQTRRFRRSVHPRTRGERTETMEISNGSHGSSSHTQGTRSIASTNRARSWFIPAYAGNANWLCAYWRTSSVHPRMRGERIFCFCALACLSGSSPHTRGTLFRY